MSGRNSLLGRLLSKVRVGVVVQFIQSANCIAFLRYLEYRTANNNRRGGGERDDAECERPALVTRSWLKNKDRVDVSKTKYLKLRLRYWF